MAKAPMRVAVTGAAGQIGYSLLFRIANGDMLGKDQPVILQLLDLPQAQAAVKGVVMELEDCAFPLLAGVVITDDPKVAFKDADVALLVGARPRSKGMERKDLLEANAQIFTVQGKRFAHELFAARIVVTDRQLHRYGFALEQDLGWMHVDLRMKRGVVVKTRRPPNEKTGARADFQIDADPGFMSGKLQEDQPSRWCTPARSSSSSLSVMLIFSWL